MDDAPRTTLSRKVWTATPSEALRPYVRAFIAQAVDVPPDETATLTIAATVYPVLSVTYAGTVRVNRHEAGQAPVPDVSLTGPIPAAFRSTLEGRPRGFFVQFEPAGALALLGVEGASFTRGPSVRQLVHPDVSDRLQAWGRAIAAVGDEHAAFGDRVALAERLLSDLLALKSLAPARKRAARTARLAAHVLDTDGTQRVREAANRLGVSTSTLGRRFREDLGMMPKRFSAIVRFRHALAYLHTDADTSWARVADRFGFADQSHLIREYKRFAGIVPSHWDDAERFIDLTFGILREGAVD